MIAMRKLSYEYKLPGRSIPEVYERFSQSLIRHQGMGRIKFTGRKLSAEAVVNAVVMRFLDLPVDDQARVLAEYVPRFESMLIEPGDPGFEAPTVPVDGRRERRNSGTDLTAHTERRAREIEKQKRRSTHITQPILGEVEEQTEGVPRRRRPKGA
jgi:hypothetical protein